MKKSFLLVVVLMGSLFLCTSVYAIPTLQLDIAGGTYDDVTDTIVATSDSFALYALLIPNAKISSTQYFYLSAALLPRGTPPDSDFGSFDITGPGGLNDTVEVNSGMSYGTPATTDGHNVALDDPHGVFPTFYKVYQFQFPGTKKAVAYNTETNYGSTPISSSTGTMYYAEFGVDTADLDPGYVIHFDLFTDYYQGGKWKLEKVAFSHDAESMGAPVPEPATMLLLGSGLIGLAGFGRKKLFKK